MNCDEAGTLIGAYSDGEIRGLRGLSIEKHLRQCANCAEKHREVLALRTRLQAELPRFEAPPELRARVRALAAATPAKPVVAPRAGERWRWLASGALAGCAATVLAWIAGSAAFDWNANRDLAVEAVGIHTRATLNDHLIEVASSDQHTVKPWLSARLDYSPPVHDLASEGFALLGGRLDSLDGQRVATLVYRHRQHMIDVFVWPDVRPDSERTLPPPRTVRGFNVARARGAGMDWLAVSDVNADELAGLVRQLARE